jgi:hypothetical protein
LWAENAALFSPQDPLYPALQGLGLIEIVNVEAGIPNMPCFPVVKADVKLIPSQHPPSDWKQISKIKWAIPLANRICTRIIGIRELPADAAEVQFEWRWRLTRYGEAVVQQRSEIERRHKDLFGELEKTRKAKEDYERSHGVWMIGQDQNISFASKAIVEDYERSRQHFVDGAKLYQSVIKLQKLDTGWQIGQQGDQELKDNLGKAEASGR